MAHEPSSVVVRGISWRDLFPWLLLFRVFQQAISVPALVLATGGLLVYTAGWRLLSFLIVSQETRDTDTDYSQLVKRLVHWPGAASDSAMTYDKFFLTPWTDLFEWAARSLSLSLWYLSVPFFTFFDTKAPWDVWWLMLFGSLWTILVWAVFGGALTRMAVVRLGREERAGLQESIGFALERFTSFFGAPLFPLLGILALAIPLWLLGLVMQIPLLGPLLGVLWILVLLVGLGMAILAVGMGAGWPLMFGAVSSERECDAFDAFSRAYSYVFQRPLNYLFYALVALVLGALGWMVVYAMSELVVGLSYWGVGLGYGREDMDYLRRIAESQKEDPESTSTWLGGQFIGAFTALVRTVAVAYAFSYLWTFAGAAYLLLRRDTDQTEVDDVAEGDASDEVYRLPPITSDLTRHRSAADIPPESETAE